MLSRKRRAGLSVGWLLASPLALLLFTLAIGVAITHRHADFSAATSGGAAWAAFAFFGKRRRGRDESEPDQLLADSAATGVDTDAALGLQLVDESQMPRWRRPSLQQVRKSDPLRAAAEGSTMSFARAGVRPLDSYERRHLRYRLVRLLDSPDEVRASDQVSHHFSRSEIVWQRHNFCIGVDFKNVLPGNINFEAADVGWKCAWHPIQVRFVKPIIVNYDE